MNDNMSEPIPSYQSRYSPLATAVFRDFAGGIVPLVVRAAGRAPLLGPSLSRDLNQ